MFAVFVLALVFIVAVVVAVVIANGTSNTVTHFRQVVGHDFNSVVNSLQGFINQYTK